MLQKFLNQVWLAHCVALTQVASYAFYRIVLFTAAQENALKVPNQAMPIYTELGFPPVLLKMLA